MPLGYTAAGPGLRLTSAQSAPPPHRPRPRPTEDSPPSPPPQTLLFSPPAFFWGGGRGDLGSHQPPPNRGGTSAPTDRGPSRQRAAAHRPRPQPPRARANRPQPPPPRPPPRGGRWEKRREGAAGRPAPRSPCLASSGAGRRSPARRDGWRVGRCPPLSTAPAPGPAVGLKVEPAARRRLGARAAAGQAGRRSRRAAVPRWQRGLPSRPSHGLGPERAALPAAPGSWKGVRRRRLRQNWRLMWISVLLLVSEKLCVCFPYRGFSPLPNTMTVKLWTEHRCHEMMKWCKTPEMM